MNKTKMICGLVFSAMAVLQAAAATIFVKPVACGLKDGSDWDNAMTLDAGFTAAWNANNGSEVRLAQGVYVKSTFGDGSVTFKMTGGWRAQSANDETRDVDAYESIVTQSSTYPTWERLTPNYVDDKPVFEAVDTELPVIADDKVSLPPAYTGATDTYRIKTKASVSNRPFMMRGGTMQLDGIWFVGYNLGCFAHLFGGTGHSIDNCRFVGLLITANGSSNNQAGIFNTTGLASVSGCKFLYTYTEKLCSGIYVHTSGLEIKNCQFEGCSRSGAIVGGNVIFAMQPVTVSECMFRRCQDLSQLEGTRQGAGSVNVNTGNIFAFNQITGGATFRRCTIRDCYTASYNSYGGTPLVFGGNAAGSQVRLEDCTVEGNVSEVRVRDGYGYPMIGRSYGGYNAYDLTQDLQLDGCTIRANTNRAVKVTDGTTSYALGIVGNGINVTGAATKFTLAKTVFDSNVVEPAPDVDGVTAVLSRGLLSVATTGSGAMSHALSNLTFTGPQANGVSDIVQYGAEHKATMKVVNSIFRVTDAATYAPFSFAKPELVTLENTTVKNLLASELPAGVTATTGYAYDDVLLSASYQPLVRTPDLMTVTAATGIANRGAVQEVVQPAGTHAVVIRCDPITDGTVQPASAVVVGDEDVTLTAVPREGLSCTGWKDANGTLVAEGSELTVSAAALTGDVVFYAVFDMAGVKLTFALGEHARFVGSGSSTYEVTASPGRAFPSIPDAVADAGYIFAGWQTAIPAVVPETAVTYAAEVIPETGTRIVRFDSNNASTCRRDGCTWSGAYSDFAEALAAALLASNAEIRVKCGVHKVATAHVLRDRLVLRGGYVGDDDDDAARTEEESVFDGNYAGVSRVATMFDLTSVACGETLVFDTVTLKNCGNYLVHGGASAHPLMTNCTFSGRANLDFSGSVRIVDCRFKNATYPASNQEIFNFRGAAGTTGLLERCTFDTCYVYTRAPVTGAAGLVRVIDCVFTNCTSSCYPGTDNMIGAENAMAVTGDDIEVVRCRVVGCVSNGGGGAFRAARRGVVADTLLANNRLHRYDPVGDGTTWTTIGKCTDRCRWFSLVPFCASESMRLERCTVVSNTLDCTGALVIALQATNRVALFTITKPNALLLNNTVLGNTVTVDRSMGGEATAYSASVVLYKDAGAGALVNNTFYENVAGDGEILAKDRTSSNPTGDWNNVWSADAALVNLKYAVWQGDKLALPLGGANRRGMSVFRSTNGTDLYVKRGTDDYVKLPAGTEGGGPADLGGPIDDIFGVVRAVGPMMRGASQLRQPSGLCVLVR